MVKARRPTWLDASGDDVLIGGLRGDKLSGSGGANVFAYASVAQSRPDAPRRDAILDFTPQRDRIDLSAINKKLKASGQKPLHFVGEGLFNGVPGELSYIDLGACLLVQADTNGDAAPDFAIRVFGANRLAAEDFAL